MISTGDVAEALKHATMIRDQILLEQHNVKTMATEKLEAHARSFDISS